MNRLGRLICLVAALLVGLASARVDACPVVTTVTAVPVLVPAVQAAPVPAQASCAATVVPAPAVVAAPQAYAAPVVASVVAPAVVAVAPVLTPLVVTTTPVIVQRVVKVRRAREFRTPVRSFLFR